MGIDVAVKIMHAHLLSDETNAKRLANEAILLNKLDSPNIVRVMDYGMHPSPFIVMEYFEGITLSSYLEKGPLPIDQAIDIFLQICEGLSAAQELNLCHRDLKPSNILIKEKEGQLFCKICDFGIARLDHTLGGERFTATGEVVGSPSYMSPEQWSGLSDHRSDIYSLGCIMYETVSGKPPFMATYGLDYLHLHSTSHPSPIAKVAPDVDCPKSLEDLIRKCTRKAPEHRYQSSKEITADLLQIKAGQKPKIEFTKDELDQFKPKSKVHKDFIILSRPQAYILSILILVLGVVSLGFLQKSNDPHSLLTLDAKWHEYDRQGQKLFDIGDLSGAKQSFQIAHDLAAKSDNKRLQRASCQELIDLYKADSKRTEAKSVELELKALAEPNTMAEHLELKLDEQLKVMNGREKDKNKKDAISRLCNDANDSAAALMEAGNKAMAAKLIIKANQLAQETLGNDDLVMVRSIHNMAILAHETGDHEKAIAGYKAAISLAEKTGKSSPAIARAYFCLGRAYVQSGQAALAENVLDKALELNRQNFGPDSQELAWCKYQRAILYKTLGQSEKARAEAEAAIAIYDGAKEPNESRKARAYLLLAWLNQDNDKYQKALSLLENQTEKDYLSLSQCLNDMAALCKNSNPKLAQSYAKRAAVLNLHQG
jgi:serine/threonine-protein kinase